MKFKNGIVFLLLILTLSACNTTEKTVGADENIEVASAEWTEDQVKQVDDKVKSVDVKTRKLEQDIAALKASLEGRTIFKDVTVDYWAYLDIMSLYEKQVIKGYPEEKAFYPERSISRYQAASMLIKVFNLPLSDSPSVFKDVPDDNWAVKEVMTAYEAGFFNGSNGNFLPKEPMSRRHMAMVIKRAFNLSEVEGSTVTDYEDVPETLSGYEEIKIISQHGVATGSNGYFKPEEPTKRSQFSAFVMRAINNQ